MGTRVLVSCVQYYAWDNVQNIRLRAGHGIGFEDAVFHIERGDLLDILDRPGTDLNPSERIFVVRQDDHIYLVPFVEDERTVFLKTIILSRKATKHYHGGVRG